MSTFVYWRTLVGAAAILSILSGTGVRAQSIFARNRDVAVADRPHPEYAPAGIPLGSFILLPVLDSSVSYVDNLYASESGKTSDVFAAFTPSALLRSTWSRNSVELTASDTLQRFSSHSSENSNEWNIAARGRYDIGVDGFVGGEATAAHIVLPRSSASYTQLTTKPIEYDRNGLAVTGQKEFNRWRVSGGVGVVDYSYSNGVSATGLTVQEDFQNRSEYSETARVDYALSPATALFLSGTASQFDYDALGRSQGRNSRGGRVLGGVNFELSHLARGEVSVGYERQRFSLTGAELKGASYRALVQYFPTQLITVTLIADKTISAGNVLGSVGYSQDFVQAKADYEFLRNVVFSGSIGRAYNDYSLLDRSDELYTATLAGTYQLNRDVGVRAGWAWTDQRSSGVARGPNFTSQTVTLALVLRH